ncbi:MAG: V-type ATP synthase subunit A [Candidatus Lokiarchaeota archaeon]|nr:V-type ATP synthase subunit A [Candidatus Lokiarchaeota archaeon]
MGDARINWISGAVVKATGSEIKNARMHEIVKVGEAKLIGEVIKLDGEVAHIQIFEESTGLTPGEPVELTGAPLSIELGPGILGGIFDGIQRPLTLLKKISGIFIKRGVTVEQLSRDIKWNFEPIIKKGEIVRGGQIIGNVIEKEYFKHYIMVPPEIYGKIENIVPEGKYTITEPIATLSNKNLKYELFLVQKWPARKPRPYNSRLKSEDLFISGQRAIDTFFPIAEGGTAAIPGGFGSGKTVTLQTLAKWSQVDLIVYIGCGERGNEMAEVLEEFPEIIDPQTNRSLMERMVLVANTSNMPVAARESSIYTGITIAEYFRDMGYSVALMADSTSRWAEALREISGYLEEIPAERGYPPYLASNLAEFFERGGKVHNIGNNKTGSVTIMGAVSPPSSDFSDPVVQIVKNLVDVFWALDKDLAYARHYPAINWNISYSDHLNTVINWYQENISMDWLEYRAKALDILRQDEELKRMVKLIGPDALPDKLRLVLKMIEILKEGFLNQNAYDIIDTFSTPNKQFKMLKIMIDFYEKCSDLVDKKVPIYRFLNLPVISEMMKMKSNVPNDELELLDLLAKRFEKELSEIERGIVG